MLPGTLALRVVNRAGGGKACSIRATQRTFARPAEGWMENARTTVIWELSATIRIYEKYMTTDQVRDKTDYKGT